MLEIDKLSYGSRWSQKKPEHKLVLYLVLLLMALLGTPLIQLGVLLLCAGLTCYLLRVGLRRYLRWLAVPLAFLFTGLLGVVLSFSWQADTLLYSIHIGHLALGVERSGLITGINTLCRSLAALASTYLFVLTTPFSQWVQLLKRSRLPLVLIEQVLLTYRFIFIFIEEAAAIHRAQSLRFGYVSLRSSYRSLSMLVGMLLARVMARHKQMSIALEVKLYNGDFHL
ncbi:energy-coupling factor ABC transporter transmembrane protein [Hafnia paralvei]|uniref:Energy-coupling factor ABC transporter transmembrane protein n=1 Tax=Hafnia paralvei TaxID=546367 RepID=A0A4Q9EJ43_9GAMM|nr:energy-coupling factor ABC transporter transmembrane protein [Hafnia paralvei]TBM24631.1 energy-coupling factor ABC transporter transmembrane protein [Hafnia paralvei]